MQFSEFITSNEINQSIKEVGYESPTPIQEKVIKAVLEKSDVIVKAQTGSGKTGSFALPILELLSKQTSTKKAKIKSDVFMTLCIINQLNCKSLVIYLIHRKYRHFF